MRKLVIGIAVVALLGLLAVPAMAYLDEKTVEVTIMVAEYGAITFNPDADMSFNVPGPYVAGANYGAFKDFKVWCNVLSTLTIVPDMRSDSTDVVPGQIGVLGDPYPTATGITGAAADGPHYIGFGLAVANFDTNTTIGWGTGEDFTKVVVNFNPSTTIDVDPNGRITVNSYMDSARYGDALAPPGDYLSTLTLTLSPAS